MAAEITVYHGTTAEHAQRILAEGLRAGTCVTTDEGLAWYYAECAVDEEGGDEEVVCAQVTLGQLHADHEALSEPVGWGGRTGSQIEQLIADRGDYSSLDASLQLCASARLASPVCADRVRICR